MIEITVSSKPVLENLSAISAKKFFCGRILKTLPQEF
jgi:hypothetical protein